MSDSCARANKAYSSGDMKTALNHSNRCIKSVEQKLRKVKQNPEMELTLRLQLAQAHMMQGQIYVQLSRVKQANRSLDASSHILDQMPDSFLVHALQGQVYYYRGILLLYQNEIDESVKSFLSAQEKYLASKQADGVINVTFKLGTVYREMCSYEDAINQFQLASKFKKMAKGKQKQLAIDALALLEEGRTRRLTNDKRTEKVLRKARKAFSKIPDAKGEAECLLELAFLYESDSSDHAREILLEAKDLGEVSDSPLILGSVYSRLGVLNLKAGEFETGKNQLLKGLKYRTEGGDKVGTAKTLVELSRIGLLTSRNNEDLESALNFVSQAFGLYEETQHEFGQATALELMGTINARLSNLDEAASQIYKGKKIFEKYKDQEAEARMLTQLGLILDLQDKAEEAQLVLEKAIKLYEKYENLQGLAEAHHVLGMQQFKHDKTSSLENLKRSKQLYTELFGSRKDMQPIIASITQTIEKLESE